MILAMFAWKIMDYKDRFKKGSVEMLLLKVLSEEDCYGYQITQIIKELSHGNIIVREPSMYPILYRLQERNLISSYKQNGNGRMERVYYHIEIEGRKELEKLISAYTQVHEGITAILNYKCLEDGLTYAK